ncbi:hypothetical protein D9M69_502660 [compost metagenome]
MNSAPVDVTISRIGADTIGLRDGSSVTSFVLRPRDTITFSAGNASWAVDEGSAALPYLPGFSAALTATGHARLPNGKIEQWGVVSVAATTGSILFPIEFTDTCFGVQITDLATGATDINFNVSPPSKSGFTWFSTQSAGGFFWTAIGK